MAHPLAMLLMAVLASLAMAAPSGACTIKGRQAALRCTASPDASDGTRVCPDRRCGARASLESGTLSVPLPFDDQGEIDALVAGLSRLCREPVAALSTLLPQAARDWQQDDRGHPLDGDLVIEPWSAAREAELAHVGHALTDCRRIEQRRVGPWLVQRRRAEDYCVRLRPRSTVGAAAPTKDRR